MSKVKLSDVAREYKAIVKDSTDLPSVGLEHLTPEEIVLEHWSEDSDNTFTKGFKKGHMLFGRRRAYLKKAALAPFNGVCSGDIIVIEAIPEVLNPELLPFVIQNERLFDFAVGNSAGSLSPRVKWESLKQYEFELPALSKQYELVELLKSAYDTKLAYRALLRATDELVKSQFIEMFEGNKFDEKTLKDISTLWIKGQPFRKESIQADGCRKCIHYGELFSTGAIIDEPSSRTNVEAVRTSKSGDILFPASDVTPDGLTKCSALLMDDVILGGDIIAMRPIEAMNPAYISCAIRIRKEQLLSRVTGSVVRHISAKSLQTVTIPTPPKCKQDEFEQLYRQSDKSK